MWVHVGNLVINLNQTSHLEVEEYDNYAYLMAYLATSNPGGSIGCASPKGTPMKCTRSSAESWATCRRVSPSSTSTAGA